MLANLRKRVDSRGNVSWQAQVRRRGIQRTSTFRTKALAETWARRAEDEIDRTRVSGFADRTVGEAIDRYLGEGDYQDRGELDQHSPTDQRNVKARLLWWNGQIGKLELEDAIPAVLLATWERAPGSGATRNRYLASLSKVFTTATREWQWMPTNPCRALKRRREGEGRVRMLTTDQRTKLLEACKTPRLRAMVLFALKTGCRLGELEALHARDVIVDRHVARIRHSKSGDPRTVHVAADVLEALHDLPARRDGLVFGKLDRRGWRKAKKAAGLVDWRFHDLRHDFASRLGQRGASESVIAAALGHKTWSQARRYTHHSPETVAELVKGFI